MSFWRTYIRNLIIVILVFGAVVICTAIFYPNALEALGLVGSFGKALLGWPIIVLILLVVALPRRKR